MKCIYIYKNFNYDILYLENKHKLPNFLDYNIFKKIAEKYVGYIIFIDKDHVFAQDCEEVILII